jgi:hypothetical protein
MKHKTQVKFILGEENWRREFFFVYGFCFFFFFYIGWPKKKTSYIEMKLTTKIKGQNQ